MEPIQVLYVRFVGDAPTQTFEYIQIEESSENVIRLVDPSGKVIYINLGNALLWYTETRGMEVTK